MSEKLAQKRAINCTASARHKQKTSFSSATSSSSPGGILRRSQNSCKYKSLKRVLVWHVQNSSLGRRLAATPAGSTPSPKWLNCKETLFSHLYQTVHSFSHDRRWWKGGTPPFLTEKHGLGFGAADSNQHPSIIVHLTGEASFPCFRNNLFCSFNSETVDKS